MEDDNGLELSLGLTFGGSSSSATKGKNINISEPKTEETDRGTKLIDDFKNFLDGGTQKQDSTTNENFFNNLSKPTVNVDNSNLNNGGFWASNDNLSTEVEVEKRSEVGNKRKGLFEEINHQKKHNNVNDKTKTSHISITTDEGSTGDNEDVADSEADSSKRQAGGSGGSKEFKHGNVSYSVQYPPQSVNMLNMPYMKESNTMQPVMNANLPVMFGYSPIQLPVLDKDNTGRGLVSQPQQFQVSYFGRGPPNSDMPNDAVKISQVPATANKSPETTQQEGRTTLDRPTEEGGGSTSHTEENTNATANTTSNPVIKPIVTSSDQPRPEGFPSDYPAIRPGIAADLKFGGSGSYPNLPWVSTTGPGPNGRTISGVTYRLSATQIRIVCACHGSHMSPEEFVQHATEEQSNADTASGLSAFPGNPATSAQS